MSKSLEVEKHVIWDEDNTGKVRMGWAGERSAVGDKQEGLAESLIL